MPDGVEVIRSPLRPVPVTVSTAVDGGGGGGGGGVDDVTVNVAFLVTLFNVAEIATGVDALTALVEIVNTALCDPIGTVTLEGTTTTAGLPLDNATVVAVAAAAESTTAPCAVEPPATLDGLTARFVRMLFDAPAGFTVRLADRVSPL